MMVILLVLDNQVKDRGFYNKNEHVSAGGCPVIDIIDEIISTWPSYRL